MDQQSAKSSASTPTSLQGPRPNTSSDSKLLTKSEIEELRRDKKESLALLQSKYFPVARLV